MGAMQVDPVVQVDAAVNIVPVQEGRAHCVPAAYLRQAPLPSQAPSRPQVEAAAIVHWSSGSEPAITFEQVPAEFAQVRQVPVQAVAQQVPCAQISELHSLPAVQVDPFGLLPQLPVLDADVGRGAVAGDPAHRLADLLVVSQPYGSQSEG